MTTQLCPYLGAADDSGVYFPTPDAANRCYAVSSDGPAYIPLNFQGSNCLTDQFGLCSRYKAAERPHPRRPARRFLVAGGGLVALGVLAVCAFLAVVALVAGGLGASRLILLARATDTLEPTATPSPTWTPTASATPTQAITDTVTVMPQPITPTATVSLSNSAGGDFVSPLATAILQPTATRPPPIATQPRPTATRRSLPTSTRRPPPTATRGPTLTPSATLTRAPTATRPVTCRYGDTMTFNPASPPTGKYFIIEVRSLTGYANVRLTGAGSPDFNGVDREGSYYVWRWEDRFGTAGTYTYSFTIEGGVATCVTKSVTVLAPTDTPTPTPTVTPVYEVGLALTGDDFRSIFTDTQPVISELNLTNGGNISDSIKVWLDASPPQGWTAQYCVGDSCSDYTVPGTQVTLPPGGSQALSIKLAASSDAPGGYALSVTLWVESLGDPTKKKSQSVTVVVTQPTASP